MMVGRIGRIAGDERYGWVWSDREGLHINAQVYERFANYLIIGGTRTVVGRRACTDGINILIAKLEFVPPQVAVYHFNRTDLIDMDVSDTCLFMASRRGLEIYMLDAFQLLNIWPGSYTAVSVLKDNVVAVANTAGTVLYLHHNDSRTESSWWEPSTFAVNADRALLLRNHTLMQSVGRPWCPQHKHRWRGPELKIDCILASCDGLIPTYIFYKAGICTVYVDNKSLWAFKAHAVDLRNDTIILLLSNRTVQVWPTSWWGTRLAILHLGADVPVQLLLNIKKLLLT